MTPAEREHALDAVTQEARIGLVAAERPADVLAVIGWGGRTSGELAHLELLVGLMPDLRSTRYAQPQEMR